MVAESRLALLVLEEELLRETLHPVLHSLHRQLLLLSTDSLAERVRVGALFREALLQAASGQRPTREKLQFEVRRNYGCETGRCVLFSSALTMAIFILVVLFYSSLLFAAIWMVVFFSVLFSYIEYPKLIDNAWIAAICDVLLDEPSGFWLNGWTARVDYLRGEARRS